MGSLAFVGAAFLASSLVLALLTITGFLNLNLGSGELYGRILVISIVSAAIELVPLGDDNVTVPVAGGFLAWLLLEPLLF